MIPRDYQLVQDSWKKLAPSIDEVSQRFFEVLFELKPKLRKKFPNPDTQGRQFMSMLNIIINGIEQIENIEDSLSKLGSTHKKANIMHTDIVCMEEALVSTFREMLPDDFNDEVEFAWRSAYRMITRHMAIR